MTLARFFPLDPLDTKVREVGDEEVAAWLERPLAMLRAFPERILYGSDFPNLPYAWDRELATLAGLDLPEPALAAILGGNALRLFAPSK
jgi:predicted TIM-barrel fold metal-dependent hydrolase